MEKVLYISPVFSNQNGQPQKFIVPADAVSTYAKRDAALQVLKALGGIYAPMTSECSKQHRKMMSAKRKIERNGWFSVLA